MKKTYLLLIFAFAIQTVIAQNEFISYNINYNTSQGTDVSEEFISKVQLNELYNDSSKDTHSGYSDYSGMVVDLEKNTSPTLTITKFWTNAIYDEGVVVWIDFNQDGDFEDEKERVMFSLNDDALISDNINIPADAKLGHTKMRISMKHNSLPKSTETFTYGEVEDYTVNIINKIVNESDFDVSQLKVIPNPFSEKIIVEFGKQLNHFRVTLIDLSGRIIFETTKTDTSTNTFHINNLEGLSNGTYLVKIIDFNSNTSITKKLTK